MDRIERRIREKYTRISDSFRSIEEVQDALHHAGLESSNLIVGIDYTASNKWSGQLSFENRSLHSTDGPMNPYEHALSVIGRTLEYFDEDKQIPCFGFGDATTSDKLVFNFNPDGSPCNGFSEAAARYRQITPHVKLAEPTSFAPIIEAAVRIVEDSGGQFHVLLIIADGQMSRPPNTPKNKLSPQEKATVEAIVGASNFALSIILVGVGDGPWDSMRVFDDNIRLRNFDNFQFVNFTDIMSTSHATKLKEARFALTSLMEVPFQFKATVELGIHGRYIGCIPPLNIIPPPPMVSAADARNYNETLASPKLPSSALSSTSSKSSLGRR